MVTDFKAGRLREIAELGIPQADILSLTNILVECSSFLLLFLLLLLLLLLQNSPDMQIHVPECQGCW